MGIIPVAIGDTFSAFRLKRQELDHGCEREVTRTICGQSNGRIHDTQRQLLFPETGYRKLPLCTFSQTVGYRRTRKPPSNAANLRTRLLVVEWRLTVTLLQHCPTPQIGDRKSSKYVGVVERPDHHCGDDLVASLVDRFTDAAVAVTRHRHMTTAVRYNIARSATGPTTSTTTTTGNQPTFRSLPVALIAWLVTLRTNAKWFISGFQSASTREAVEHPVHLLRRLGRIIGFNFRWDVRWRTQLRRP